MREVLLAVALLLSSGSAFTPAARLKFPFVRGANSLLRPQSSTYGSASSPIPLINDLDEDSCVSNLVELVEELDRVQGEVRELSAPWQKSNSRRDGREFPLILGPSSELTSFSGQEALTAWVAEHREMLLQACLAHGAVLLRGFPVAGAQGFGDICRGLGLKAGSMEGSAAPRRYVSDDVFTANESPPSEPIPFHHEMAQTNNPPAYIMFYCETPSAEGGETPIVLSDEVAAYVEQAHPKFAADLRAHGVRYHRTMPEQTDSSSALGSSWRTVFKAESRAEAEEALAAEGSGFDAWEFVPPAVADSAEAAAYGRDLRTTTVAHGALAVDGRTGREVFFNQVVAAYTGWDDARNNPKEAVTLGNGQPLDEAAMADICSFVEQRKVAFPWEAGDVLLIDNRVAMHSRNTFAPPRRILTSIWGTREGASAGDDEDAAAAANDKADFLQLRGGAGAGAASSRSSGGGGSKSTLKASQQPTLTLRSGDKMPVVGLGTWKISTETTADVVVDALKLGYRHLDCACDYGNEQQVGEGIRRAIDEGVIGSREELWVTSKLWNTYHAKEHVPLALQRTLDDLGLDYLDLYLVHFPIALKFVPFEERYPPEWVFDPSQADGGAMEYARVPMQETWEAMEELLASPAATADSSSAPSSPSPSPSSPAAAAKVRNIGLCNVNAAGLRDLLNYAKVPPAVLQIERHAYLQQPKLMRYCEDAGVAVTGFSPLGSSSYVELDMATPGDSALAEPAVAAIAEKHRRSPAQVLLRWGLDTGTAVIPKSSKVARLAENLDVFDFSLDEEDLEALSVLDKNRRFNDPGDFTTGMNSFCPIYD